MRVKSNVNTIVYYREDGIVKQIRLQKGIATLKENELQVLSGKMTLLGKPYVEYNTNVLKNKKGAISEQYEELFGKPVPNNKKNNQDWIVQKVKEKLEEAK